MAENHHGRLALIEIQFVHSFIYFKSANSFQLTDGRRPGRPLKILNLTRHRWIFSEVWLLSPYWHRFQLWLSYFCSCWDRNRQPPPARLEWRWQTTPVRAEAALQPGQAAGFCTFNYLINFLLLGGYLALSWCLLSKSTLFVWRASAPFSVWHLFTWGYSLLFVFSRARVSVLLPQINLKTTNQS